jgi:hypothetical protein
MEATEAYVEMIKSIMGNMQCPRAFECYTSGFQKLCAARPVKGGRLTECGKDGQAACKFAVDFGLGRFCECPLRSFLLKTLHI